MSLSTRWFKWKAYDCKGNRFFVTRSCKILFWENVLFIHSLLLASFSLNMLTTCWDKSGDIISKDIIIGSILWSLPRPWHINLLLRAPVTSCGPGPAVGARLFYKEYWISHNYIPHSVCNAGHQYIYSTPYCAPIKYLIVGPVWR